MAKPQEPQWQDVVHPAKYWKLPPFHKKTKPELQAYLSLVNYHFHKNDDKSRLVELAGLHYRGGLSYHACSVTELQDFVRVRGLPVQTGMGKRNDVKKAYLASALEDADEQRTFHHFEDLPAELRVRVYELHFEDVLRCFSAQSGVPRRRSMNLAVPPPVTEVSKLLRQESLALFYQRASPRLDMFKRSKCFSTGIDDGHARLLRQITFREKFSTTCADGTEQYMGWDLVLLVKPSDDNERLQIVCKLGGCISEPPSTIQFNKIYSAITEIVKQVNTRIDKTLRKDDLAAIHQAIYGRGRKGSW